MTIPVLLWFDLEPLFVIGLQSVWASTRIWKFEWRALFNDRKRIIERKIKTNTTTEYTPDPDPNPDPNPHPYPTPDPKPDPTPNPEPNPNPNLETLTQLQKLNEDKKF